MHFNDIKINELESIARKAGDKILEIYHSASDDWEVSMKSDDSPLTKADQASNEIICSELERLYPEIPIISEENKEVPYEARSKYNLFWLVDPLDGTKEFIKRNGEFTVNIALVEKTRVVMGVVFVPVLNKLYWARKDEGSFLLEEGKEAQRLSAQGFSLEDEGLVFVASRSHINEETKAFINRFSKPESTSMGSSLKLVLVAEGKAHIYPRLGPTMEWDTAAAQIIVEEAGGKVVNYKDEKTFTYNKESLLNGYFVVYGKVK